MAVFNLFRSRILFLLVALTALFSCKDDMQGELIMVEANPGKGFNYSYYLFLPEGLTGEEEKYLLVEPNNTGAVSDDIKKHSEKARRTATRDFYLGNYAARKLPAPLLVPVFPRDKKNSHMYTHSLDRDVVLETDNDLERIDLQLLVMVEDAKQRLQKKGISIAPDFLMTGFSASGTFVNRFTLIHPDKVMAVAAGGLNGILMLPLSEEKQQELKYPAGTHDFEQLFGKTFDSVAFMKTPQFYFMGGLDENDALPYSDAYDEPERKAIENALGKEMLPARWKRAKELYAREEIKAEVKTYEKLGHEHPKEVKDEIVAFFKKVVRE